MQFINLTPHKIVVRLPEGDGDIVIPPSGTVARRSVTEQAADDIAGIPVVRRRLGQVEGLPGPEPGTVFIVSSLVLDGLDRDDVVAPDTGASAIREGGQVVAVTRFVRA